MAVHLNRTKLSALCGALGIIALAGVTRTPVSASATLPETVVTMTEHNQFSPNELHVQVGQTVTWRNDSQVEHTVTGPGFDSGPIAPGRSFSHTFDAVATVQYYCKPHQAMGMVGRVEVSSK
jgi:plastocyanin